MLFRIFRLSIKHLISRLNISIILIFIFSCLFFTMMYVGSDLFGSLQNSRSVASQTVTLIPQNVEKEHIESFIKGLAKIHDRIDSVAILGVSDVDSNSSETVSVQEACQVITYVPHQPTRFPVVIYEGVVPQNANRNEILIINNYRNRENNNIIIHTAIYSSITINKKQATICGFGSIGHFSLDVDEIAIITSYDGFFDYTNNINKIEVYTLEGFNKEDSEYLYQVAAASIMPLSVDESISPDAEIQRLVFLSLLAIICITYIYNIMRYLFTSRMLEYSVYRIVGGNFRHVLVSVISEYIILSTLAILLTVIFVMFFSSTTIFPIQSNMSSPYLWISIIVVFFISSAVSTLILIPAILQSDVRKMYLHNKL